MNCKIPLPSTKSTQSISSKVPLPKSYPRLGINRNPLKSRAIKSFPARKLRPRQVQRLSRDDVWASERLKSRIQRRSKINQLNWWSRPNLENILKRPAPENCICEGIDFADRDVISQAHRKGVPNVKVGSAPIRACVDSRHKGIS